MDGYGSIPDEAMPAASGASLGEATRALIVIDALHPLLEKARCVAPIGDAQRGYRLLEIRIRGLV